MCICGDILSFVGREFSKDDVKILHRCYVDDVVLFSLSIAMYSGCVDFYLCWSPPVRSLHTILRPISSILQLRFDLSERKQLLTRPSHIVFFISVSNRSRSVLDERFRLNQ